MTELEPELTPGAKANVDLVSAMEEAHPELAELIPEGCMHCSTAWLHASHGRAVRLTDCPGRHEIIIGLASREVDDIEAEVKELKEKTVGQFAVLGCHLPPGLHPKV